MSAPYQHSVLFLGTDHHRLQSKPTYAKRNYFCPQDPSRTEQSGQPGELVAVGAPATRAMRPPPVVRLGAGGVAAASAGTLVGGGTVPPDPRFRAPASSYQAVVEAPAGKHAPPVPAWVKDARVVRGVSQRSLPVLARALLMCWARACRSCTFACISLIRCRTARMRRSGERARGGLRVPALPS